MTHWMRTLDESALGTTNCEEAEGSTHFYSVHQGLFDLKWTLFDAMLLSWLSPLTSSTFVIVVVVVAVMDSMWIDSLRVSSHTKNNQIDWNTLDFFHLISSSACVSAWVYEFVSVYVSPGTDDTCHPHWHLQFPTRLWEHKVRVVTICNYALKIDFTW